MHSTKKLGCPLNFKIFQIWLTIKKRRRNYDLISSVVQKTHSIGPKLAGKLYMQKLKTGMKFVIFFTSGLLSTK